MKQIIFAITSVAIIVLGFLIVMTIEHSAIRKNELDDSLSASVEATIEELEASGKYSIDDQETFVAAFNERLLNDINAGTMNKNGEYREDENLKIRVEVMSADSEKGILGLKVKEEFTHPNGSIGNCECEALAVLERTGELGTHRVRFMDEGKTYAEMIVEDGNTFPEIPSVKEPKFKYWSEKGQNNPAYFPERVNKDLEYEAIYD